MEMDLAIEASGTRRAPSIEPWRSVVFGGTVGFVLVVRHQAAVLTTARRGIPPRVGCGSSARRFRPSTRSSSRAGPTQRRLAALACDLLAHLELDALITHRFSIQQAAEAYALVDQHPDQTVQVILTYP